MSNFKNQDNFCETCVSMENEVKDLHETLNKFTKETKTLTWFYQVKGIP